MCRSIHDLAQTSCIKTEHAVEDVCQLLSILAHTFTHPLAHIASFGDSRWIFLTRSYTLSSILMSACQASWTRHVRSEEVATSSRCVARPSLASRLTCHMSPTQNTITFGFASDMTPTALPQAGTVPTTRSTNYNEGYPGHAELASCTSPRTGGAGQARG